MSFLVLKEKMLACLGGEGGAVDNQKDYVRERIL